MKTMGYISLVGAGPGVKDYLTLRAVDRLKKADIVLYDALVDSSILALSGEAECRYVGKRAGSHSMSQTDIIDLMIRSACSGKRVVRLKAGDPFVLGRGGEEAVALGEAGVPYEVVPGLSSALSAPLLSGIPVTHRGLSSACIIVSGHDLSVCSPVLSSLAPASATIVLLMGYAQRHAIAQVLLDKQWSGDTPAAMVAGAGTNRQKLWLGSLAALAKGSLPMVREGGMWDPRGEPVTVVIGDTVGLADKITPPVATDTEDALPVSTMTPYHQPWPVLAGACKAETT